MSGIASMAATSAVIRGILMERMTAHQFVGTTLVTAVAPDLVPLDSMAEPRLNLFLHRVSRNRGYPDVPSYASEPGASVYGKLVVDLHYVLTAYAHKDTDAEFLLGEAMLILHENQRISRGEIRRMFSPALNPPPQLQPPDADATGISDQNEAITVTFEPFSTEDMSHLWSTFQSRYRPSACYLVTAVELEHERRAPIPRVVLYRGVPDAQGIETGPSVNASMTSPRPTITAIVIPGAELSATLGSTISLQGTGLAVTGVTAEFSIAGSSDSIIIPVTVPTVASDRISVTLATQAGRDWRAGLYALRVRVPGSHPGESRVSEALPCELAPNVDWSTATLTPVVVHQADGDHPGLTLTVTVTPEVFGDQDVIVYLGGIGVRRAEVPAAAVALSTSTIEVTFVDLAPGSYPARLSVDGVETHLFDRTASPITIPNERKVVVP